jgi:hypothetical protein
MDHGSSASTFGLSIAIDADATLSVAALVGKLAELENTSFGWLNSSIFEDEILFWLIGFE